MKKLDETNASGKPPPPSNRVVNRHAPPREQIWRRNVPAGSDALDREIARAIAENIDAWLAWQAP